jgi:biopolymer transport protein ExbD
MSNDGPISQDAMRAVDEPPITLRRRRRVDDEMDITPMIDITFLLLIFFLVAAKLESPASIDLPPARYGKPVVGKNAVALLVTRGGGQRVVVTTGHDERIPPRDLLAQEERITEYVRKGLAGRPPFESPKDHVLIKAERTVRTGEVNRVFKAAGKAREGQQLHIAVLEVR